MPAIRKSADLRNNYGEIEELMDRLELYQAIEVGLNQIENGETITEEEMLEHIKSL